MRVADGNRYRATRSRSSGRHSRGDRGKKGMGLTVRHVEAVRKGARVPRGLSTRDRHPRFTLSGPSSPSPPSLAPRPPSGTVLDVRSPPGKIPTPVRRDSRLSTVNSCWLLIFFFFCFALINHEYCLSSILPVALLIFIYLPFSSPRDVRVILGACRTCDVSADKDSSLVFFLQILRTKKR